MRGAAIADGDDMDRQSQRSRGGQQPAASQCLVIRMRRQDERGAGPQKRIGRDRFVRNCLYAAGNSGAAQLLPLVSGLCSDPDSVVADAARWAAHRLTAA